MPLPGYQAVDWSSGSAHVPVLVFNDNDYYSGAISVPHRLVFPGVEQIYENKVTIRYYLKPGSKLQKYLHRTNPLLWASPNQQVLTSTIDTELRHRARARDCSIRGLVYCVIRAQGEQIPDSSFESRTELEDYIKSLLHPVRCIKRHITYNVRGDVLPNLGEHGRAFVVV
jgi:hypothetical protein